MAALTGNTIASSYSRLLTTTSASFSGGAETPIQDGINNSSALSLGTLGATATGTLRSIGNFTVGTTVSPKFSVTALTGLCSLFGDLAINTNKFTVASATGNTTIAGDLAINVNKLTVAAATGNTAIVGTLAVANDLSVNTNKLTVAAATGNTAILGNLAVNTNKLTVAAATGNTTILGDLAVNTNKLTVAAATGNTVVAGTLGVTGSVSVNSKVTLNASSGNIDQLIGATINGARIGVGPGAPAVDISNFMAGASAFLSNTTGSDNVVCGNNTLQNSTIGDHNTALGSSALQSSVIGQFSTAIGSKSQTNLNCGPLTTTGAISSISVTKSGSGYTSAPAVTIDATTPAATTVATATSVIVGGVVTEVNLTSAGAGYPYPPTITLAVSPTVDNATAQVAAGTNNTSVGFKALGGAASRVIAITSSTAAVAGLSTITSAVHGLVVGARINITVSGNTGIPVGVYTVATVPLATTFTIASTTAVTGVAGTFQAWSNALNNTVVGAFSAQSFTNGNNNTLIGARSMISATTAQNNVAVGFQALRDTTTTNDCVAVGVNSLLNTTGVNNTGLGRSAGLSLTSGQYNTLIGAYSGAGDFGLAVSTGSNNTLVGEKTNVDTVARNYCVALGRGAVSGAADGTLSVGAVAPNAMANLTNVTIPAAPALLTSAMPRPIIMMTIYLNGVRYGIPIYAF